MNNIIEKILEKIGITSEKKKMENLVNQTILDIYDGKVEYFQLSPELKGNSKVALEALKINGMNIKYVPKELTDKSNEYIQEALDTDVDAIAYADDDIRNNKELGLMIVDRKGPLIRFLSEDLQNDIDIVKKAVMEDILTVEYLSEEMKTNSEIIDIIIESESSAIYYLDTEIQKDIVRKNPELLEYSKDLETDSEFIIELMEAGKIRATEALGKLDDNEEVCLKAISIYGYSVVEDKIAYSLKENPEFIAAVYDEDKKAAEKLIKYYLGSDSEAVKKVIETTGDGRLIFVADDSVRNNKEAVLASIKEGNVDIDSIGEELKKDSKFWEAAADIAGFSGKIIQQDEITSEIVINLIENTNDIRLIEKVSEEFYKDMDILKAALEVDVDNIYYLKDYISEVDMKILADKYEDVEEVYNKMYFNEKELPEVLKNDFKEIDKEIKNDYIEHISGRDEIINDTAEKIYNRESEIEQINASINKEVDKMEKFIDEGEKDIEVLKYNSENLEYVMEFLDCRPFSEIEETLRPFEQEFIVYLETIIDKGYATNLKNEDGSINKEMLEDIICGYDTEETKNFVNEFLINYPEKIDEVATSAEYNYNSFEVSGGRNEIC